MKEFPHGHEFGTRSLAKNSTTELELPAFFMPDGTKTVSARTGRVTFADASVWDRADVLTDEDVPYVVGTAKLNVTRSDWLRAGYVGLDNNGKATSGMAGLSASASMNRGSVSSTTNKPRISSLRLEESTACKFSHVQMIPGKYLVYIRRGERNCDWKWVTVDNQSKLNIALEVDDGQTGALEVTLPDTPGTKKVELIPLDETGTAPIPDADLPKARISYWLGTSLKPEAGKAVFDGLKSGKYRVLAGSLSKDVELLTGKTVSLSLP